MMGSSGRTGDPDKKRKFKTTRNQGDWGVLKATEYFISEGYEIFMPTTEATRVDMMITKDDREVIKVQVKTSMNTPTEGRSFSVMTSTMGHNRTNNVTLKCLSAKEIDLLFVWCEYDGRESWWIFPAEEVEGKTSISVGRHNAEGHMVKGSLAPEVPRGRPRVPGSRRRSRGKEVYFCITEGCEKRVSREGNMCRSHGNQKSATGQFKIEWPADDDLIALTEEVGFSEAGRRLGVSDNAIKKRLRARGLLGDGKNS